MGRLCFFRGAKLFLLMLLFLAFLCTPGPLHGQKVVRLMARQPAVLNTSVGPSLRVPRDTTITLGKDLVVTGGVAPYSYSWLRNGVVVSSLPEISVLADKPAKYAVVVTDSRGCTSTGNIDLAVGLNDLGGSAFRIYPVPSKGTINIDTGNDDIVYSCTIYDSFGSAVWKGEAAGSGPLTVNLAPGLYVLELSWKGTVLRRKIIVS